MVPRFALRLLCLLPLLGALGCGAADGALLVTVRGVDERVTELRTTVTLDGLRLAGAERVPQERLERDGDSVRFRLAPPPGRGGDLVIAVEALRPDGRAVEPSLAEDGAGCFVSAGRSAALPLPGDALEVQLEALPAPKCCDAGWLCWESPAPHNHGINALWARGEEVYAVGDRGALLHRVGGAFRREPSGTTADLVGLWGGDGAPWIIGAQAGAGLLLRATGQGAKEQRALPVPAAAVWGWADELWVAGADRLYRMDAQGQPLGEPEALGAGLSITGLWGRAATDAWLVGYDDGGAVIRRREGTSWSANVAPAGLLGPGRRADAVQGQGSNLWVLAHGAGQLLLAHYDGAAWRVSGSMNAVYAPEEDRFGLHVAGPGELWLGNGALLRLTGWPALADWQRAAQGWAALPEQAPDPWVRAVFSDGGDSLWAAGSGGRIWRLARDRGTWSQAYPAPGTALDTFLGLSVPLRGEALLAGARGLYKMSVEKPIERIRQGRFNRVIAGDEIIALEGGTALSVGGQRVAESQALLGLWAREGEVWAVGDRVVHARGAARLPDEPVPGDCNVQELRDVWGDAGGELFAVGRADCILRRPAGGAWQADHREPLGLDLYGVFGNGAGEVFAVGQRGGGDGAILRRDPAGRWAVERSGLLYALRGVWAGDDEAWAMGERGQLLHRRRGEWVEEAQGRSLGVGDSIYYPVGPFGLRSDDVWFIGKHGTVLRYRPPRP